MQGVGIVSNALLYQSFVSVIMYDIISILKDFPILSRKVYGQPLVYLDNAATTQKPLCVLDAMRDEYLNVNDTV